MDALWFLLISPQMKSLHKLIKKEHIYTAPDHDYGLEDEPHITVLYGLHKEVTQKEVKEIKREVALICYFFLSLSYG